MSKEQYARLSAWLIGAWGFVALVASALHLFNGAPGQPPIALGLSVVIPVVVFLMWFARSPGFRDYLLSLNARTLTIVQSWRVGGFVFLVLYSYGILPGLFALPAGWGDIAIGATAYLAAVKLGDARRRRSFILWQLLGTLDLVLAIALGVTARFIRPAGISTDAMSVLPLSLIPTFVVPLLLMLHFICIAQARRWPTRQESSPRMHLNSSVA